MYSFGATSSFISSFFLIPTFFVLPASNAPLIIALPKGNVFAPMFYKYPVLNEIFYGMVFAKKKEKKPFMTMA